MGTLHPEANPALAGQDVYDCKKISCDILSVSQSKMTKLLDEDFGLKD